MHLCESMKLVDSLELELSRREHRNSLTILARKIIKYFYDYKVFRWRLGVKKILKKWKVKVLKYLNIFWKKNWKKLRNKCFETWFAYIFLYKPRRRKVKACFKDIFINIRNKQKRIFKTICSWNNKGHWVSFEIPFIHIQYIFQGLDVGTCCWNTFSAACNYPSCLQISFHHCVWFIDSISSKIYFLYI